MSKLTKLAIVSFVLALLVGGMVLSVAPTLAAGPGKLHPTDNDFHQDNDHHPLPPLDEKVNQKIQLHIDQKLDPKIESHPNSTAAEQVDTKSDLKTDSSVDTWSNNHAPLR